MGGAWRYVRHRSLRIKKNQSPSFSSRLGKEKKTNKQIRNRTASTVRGKLNLGQVQSAARLLALIIEQCHGPLSALPSPRPPLEFTQPRIDHALGEHGLQKVPH